MAHVGEADHDHPDEMRRLEDRGERLVEEATRRTTTGRPIGEIRVHGVPLAVAIPPTRGYIGQKGLSGTMSDHEAAAMTFRRRATELDGVDELYVFGSVARGDTDEESDVDVLAVLAEDADFAAVDDELLDVAYDVGLQYDVPVEVHSIPAGEFADRKERGDPFVHTVLEAGEVGA